LTINKHTQAIAHAMNISGGIEVSVYKGGLEIIDEQIIDVDDG